MDFCRSSLRVLVLISPTRLKRRKDKKFNILYHLHITKTSHHKNVPLPGAFDLSPSLMIYEKQAPRRSIRNKKGFVDTPSLLTPVKYLVQ
jgi:hypothetical protein